MTKLKILEIQIREQKTLLKKYKEEIKRKNEQLLSLETMIVDNVVDDMINKERGK